MVLAGSQDNPESIAVGGDTLYWTSSGTNSGVGTVKKVGFGGGVPELVGDPTTLAPRDILVTPDGILVWTVADPNAAMGGTAGRIQRLDLNDLVSGVQDVVTGLTSPEGLTYRNGQVYWTIFGPVGGIYGASLFGTNTAGPPLAPGYYPLRVVADDSYLYWIEEGIHKEMDGAVRRYSLATSMVEPIATGQGDAPRDRARRGRQRRRHGGVLDQLRHRKHHACRRQRWDAHRRARGPRPKRAGGDRR